MDKPLFIPLKAEFYDAFVSGDKKEELRKWGKRWNAKVCQVGRRVVLSRGYGKKHRTQGIIRMVRIGSLEILTDRQRESMMAIYGNPRLVVIAIEIEVLSHV